MSFNANSEDGFVGVGGVTNVTGANDGDEEEVRIFWLGVFTFADWGRSGVSGRGGTGGTSSGILEFRRELEALSLRLAKIPPIPPPPPPPSRSGLGFGLVARLVGADEFLKTSLNLPAGERDRVGRLRPGDRF